MSLVASSGMSFLRSLCNPEFSGMIAGMFGGFTMSHLYLFVFGQPRLEREGMPIDLNLRKALALLAYLAVSDQLHSRDALATLLWPESDGRAGRARLRRTLHRLNEAIGDDILDSGPEAIRLHANADLGLDSAAFRRHAIAGLATASDDVSAPERLARLAAAVALYREDFLAGFTLPDASAFDEWQFFERESLRQLLAQVLEALVQQCGAQGAWEAALPHARRWVALDPLHEPAQQHLMMAYAWAGQQAAAVRQYQECARVLDAELGVAPDEATTALYDAIRFRRFPPPADDSPLRSQQEATLLSQRADGPPSPGEAVSPKVEDDHTQVGASTRMTRAVGREAELRRLHEHLGRALERELGTLKGRLASSQGDELLARAVNVGGLKVLAARLDGADAKALRDTIDQLKNKLKTAAIVLAAVEGGKVQIVAGVTADSADRVKAGELVNFVARQVGGKGGGKPDLAMAGGTDPSKVGEALASVSAWVKERL